MAATELADEEVQARWAGNGCTAIGRGDGSG